MRRFKHSGASGDLVYSLPIMRHLGGGEFYLHLDQLNWIGQHYYGNPPASFHQDRLNSQDVDNLRPLLEAQPYISHVGILEPNTEITHNLDRFRPAFVGHPTNYIDLYSQTFGIRDPEQQRQIRHTPWLAVPQTRAVPSRPWVINRTERWIPPSPAPQWQTWLEEGRDAESIFVGSVREFELFKLATGWKNIEYQPTQNLLELAEYIAGAEVFVGNQSLALALAVGLGRPYWCEHRRDLPLNRNECYFPDQPGGNYF